MSVSLEQAKEHLRVTTNDEDALIGIYVSAADAWLRRYCGTGYVEDAPELVAAQLLIIGHLDANRELSAPKEVFEVPFAVTALAGPFRTPTIA